MPPKIEPFHAVYVQESTFPRNHLVKQCLACMGAAIDSNMLVSDDVPVLTCSHHSFLMLNLKQLVKSLTKYFEPST